MPSHCGRPHHRSNKFQTPFQQLLNSTPLRIFWETIHYSLSLSISQQTVSRPGQLEREARRLGRSLVGTGDEDEDEDDYDDDFDDDLLDMEESNVVSTRLLRSGKFFDLFDCLPEFCQLIWVQ